ncbi:MAG: hypothetical protein AAF597_19920, partial [Bacteroidota bacterium]
HPLNSVIERIQAKDFTPPEQGKPLIITGPDNGVFLELSPAKKLENPLSDDEQAALSKLIGPRIALLHPDDVRALADELPVLARNSLNNGISTQLWYEEVVPRQAVFYCCLDTLTSGTAITKVSAAIVGGGGTIQIGGNATVGYGRTRWTILNPSSHA